MNLHFFNFLQIPQISRTVPSLNSCMSTKTKSVALLKKLFDVFRIVENVTSIKKIHQQGLRKIWLQ